MLKDYYPLLSVIEPIVLYLNSILDNPYQISPINWEYSSKTSSSCLAVRIVLPDEELAILFEDRLVFQIVASLAGEEGSNWAEIENKDFSNLEIELLRFVMAQSFPNADLSVYPVSPNCAKQFMQLTIQGPQTHGSVWFPDIPTINLLDSCCLKAEEHFSSRLNVLVNLIHREIPQVGAVILTRLSDNDKKTVAPNINPYLARAILSRMPATDCTSVLSELIDKELEEIKMKASDLKFH